MLGKQGEREEGGGEESEGEEEGGGERREGKGWKRGKKGVRATLGLLSTWAAQDLTGHSDALNHFTFLPTQIRHLCPKVHLIQADQVSACACS